MDLACRGSSVHKPVSLFLVRLLNPDTIFETDCVSVFAKIVSYIGKLIKGVK